MRKQFNTNALELAKSIKLVIFDVDGVLTDGSLYFTGKGDAMKTFDVHDGLGMTFLRDAGIELAIITGRKSKIVVQRAAGLGIQHVYQNAMKKIAPYEKLLAKLNLTDGDVAYVGDDLLDLPVIRRVKLGIAVANAVPYVKEHADYVTEHSGGHGAAREVCDLILTAQNKFEALVNKYL